MGSIEGINWSSLLICGKHERIAYAARRGRKWVVVVDGVAGKEYDQLTTFDWFQGSLEGPLDPGFSPDCKRIAHTARRDKDWFLVVDGVEGEGYESIIEGIGLLEPKRGWVGFSPDGKHIAHTAKRQGRWLEVVDGVERSEAESIRAPFTLSDSRAGFGDLGNAVSPDGQRNARIQTRDNERFVVVDGRELKKYQVLVQGALHTLAGLQTALTGNVEAQEVSGNGPYGPLIFSPDSQRLAYLVQWGDKESVAVDETEYAAYERYNSVQDYVLVELATGHRGYWFTHQRKPNLPAFSPDSRHIAYLARRGDEYFVVVDGVESQAYDAIRYRPLSPFFWEHPKFIVTFASPTRLHTLAVRDGQLIRVEVDVVGELDARVQDEMEF